MKQDTRYNQYIIKNLLEVRSQRSIMLLNWDPQIQSNKIKGKIEGNNTCADKEN